LAGFGKLSAYLIKNRFLCLKKPLLKNRLIYISYRKSHQQLQAASAPKPSFSERTARSIDITVSMMGANMQYENTVLTKTLLRDYTTTDIILKNKQRLTLLNHCELLDAVTHAENHGNGAIAK